MNNNELLATQMTQTYFMIMSPRQKEYFTSDLTLYTEKYRQAYNTCLKRIEEQEKDNSYNELNTLLGRLK